MRLTGLFVACAVLMARNRKEGGCLKGRDALNRPVRRKKWGSGLGWHCQKYP